MLIYLFERYYRYLYNLQQQYIFLKYFFIICSLSETYLSNIIKIITEFYYLDIGIHTYLLVIDLI